MNQTTKTILTIVITVLVVSAGFYIWHINSQNISQHNRKDNQRIVSSANNIKQKKSINSVTQDKKLDKKITYKNDTVGFSLEYPENIYLINDNNKFPGDKIALEIRVDRIRDMDYPMGHDQKTAQNNQQSLKNGIYGQNVDWPLEASKTIRNLGSVNAQEFILLGRFEVCDVVFERKIIFYRNAYQVEIILHGATNDIVAENQKYFKLDLANCGNKNKMAWKDQNIFYWDIKQGKITGSAQDWFSSFDKIVKSIKIY